MDHLSIGTPCRACGSKIPQPATAGGLGVRLTVRCPGCGAQAVLTAAPRGSEAADIHDLIDKIERDVAERMRDR